MGISVLVVRRKACVPGRTLSPFKTAFARSSRSPRAARSASLVIVCRSPSSASTISASASWISQRARSRVEHEMTLPPYMSVGLPSTPQRPGAVETIKERTSRDER
jgi:hypothetical protein